MYSSGIQQKLCPYTAAEQELLKLCTGNSFPLHGRICGEHKRNFLTRYYFYQKQCSNPFALHPTKTIKKSLREISSVLAKQCPSSL